MVIYKYPLIKANGGRLELPYRHVVLHAGEQNGELMLWAMVDDQLDFSLPETTTIGVSVIGTGRELFPIDAEDYFSTVQMSNGLVWHIFLQGATRKLKTFRRTL